MADDLDARLRTWGEQELRAAGAPPAGLLTAPKRARTRWQPLAAAAAVVATAVAAALLVAQPERDAPTPPASSPSPVAAAELGTSVRLLRALPEGHALLATSGGRGWRLLELAGDRLTDRTPSQLTSDDHLADVATSEGAWWLVTQDCVTGRGVLLWRSTDAGRSWSRTPFRHGVSCSAGSGAMVHLPAAGSVAVSYVSHAGEESSLTRSTDGGATWSAPAELPLSAHPVFLSAEVAFQTSALTGEGVRSSDGGRTWSPLAEVAGACSTSTVTVISPTDAVVATAKGLTISELRTTDGGETWVQTPIEYLKRGPHCAAPQLLAVGDRTLWTLATGGLLPTLSRHTGGDRSSWWYVDGPDGLDRALEAYQVQLLPTGDRTALLALTGDGTRTFRTDDAGGTWQELAS